MANPLADAAAGVALLPRGFALLARRPRLFWRGMIPALVCSLVFLGLFVALLLNSDAVAAALTPWAAGWSSASLVRLVVALAVCVGSGLLLLVSFTAVTLAVGGPIYDSLAEALERDLGGLPEKAAEPWSRAVPRVLRQVAALVGLSVVVALLVFLVGLIPVVGTGVAAVLSAALGGWLMTLDLVGSTLELRGVLTLAGRNQILRRRRWKTLGFAAPTFVLLSVPVVAVVAFPVAKAAATLLARDVAVRPG